MTEQKAKMAETRITQEMIDGMRARLGTKLRIDDSTHNEYATRMAILKFTHGIGDSNPLWSDEAYAVNQRGEDVMPGYAIVALPSKNNGIFPLEKRVKSKVKKRPVRKSSKS
jgi:hypothetical protein